MLLHVRIDLLLSVRITHPHREIRLGDIRMKLFVDHINQVTVIELVVLPRGKSQRSKRGRILGIRSKMVSNARVAFYSAHLTLELAILDLGPLT